MGGVEFKFSLAEALKKGPVVLYFYPKSFTSVCTVEAHEFAENTENFAAAGASVIGLSGDKIEVRRGLPQPHFLRNFARGKDSLRLLRFQRGETHREYASRRQEMARGAQALSVRVSLGRSPGPFVAISREREPTS